MSFFAKRGNSPNKTNEKIIFGENEEGDGDAAKDANDAYRQDLDLNIYLKKAKTIPETNILKFVDIKELVQRRIMRYE